ncbi:MAG: transglycosylase domain-containing protein [Clostridia bacterium]|nr:transglycosylase domain-containing protein [Clostridia bacterium]
MKTALKILGYSLIITLIIIFSVIIYLISITKNYSLIPENLSTTVKIYEFYDNDRNLICREEYGGNRKYVSINKLSNNTINAFIAIEDRKFYKHNGIDYKRILGASLKNLKSMSFKEGASTISQQLIKNTHLTNEKTLKRKVIEYKLTKELEKKYEKNQILEKYLNSIYFGKNAYGINEASEMYFNKGADKLTLSESAILAGLIKAPNVYSPYASYENSIKRKNTVLKAMFDCGFISFEEYNNCKNEAVKVYKNVGKQFFDDYVKAVKLQVEDIIKLNPYTNSKVKIYTYLDTNLQKQMFNNKIEEVSNCDKNQIAINSKINGVIAFCGNNSILKRTPASTVKPWLIYAPMIEEKYITESSVVLDEKINISGYSPKNYQNKYYGNVTIKDALKNSLNIPPVKLLDGFGINKVNKYANKMGINIKNEGLSCALGAIEGGMTLKEICDAYSVFNNMGNYSTSNFIKSIKKDGIEIYKSNKKEVKVFSEETVYIINDILKEATKSGTAKKLKEFSFDLCAKTGTNGDNFGNTDVYSISYTKNHIIGTWLGNENGKALNNNVTGGGYATILNREIVKNLYKNCTPDNFTLPKNIIKAKIDKEFLIKNKETLLLDNGEEFYYIKGTEPSKKANNSKFKFLTPIIKLNNNRVTIKNSSENCEKLKIIRNFKGKSTEIYNGKYIIEYIEELKESGKYVYTLYFYDKNGNEFISELKSVYYEKQSVIDNWWDL